jgi:pilus assembly protein FimV
MAFNKNKALESALKFLNQGKVPQAIGEYQQILRHDPKDQATLMTVGDLFARQGDMTQAIEYFERLAQVYLNDGFNSKAIAIYKKIAKLAPAELAPLERLADLYVQQGVLSEARPLFLQIAEAHLKANRAPKAVEVLHRLLEVEPENPRVQMRLAELYNVMGQKKEAAQTYLAYAQRLFDRGESEEAQKLIERALGVDASNAPALLLKAKILGAAHKSDEAISILESHPDADAGTEVTNLLVDFEIGSGKMDKAANRARKQLARGSSHTELFERVVNAFLDAGRARETLPLLSELRAPLIETANQDKFSRLLSTTIEKLPGDTEPLEMLADFSRHNSDPFQLTAALSRLVDAYSAAGNYSRAEETMQEMIERNKGDERLVARLEKLRARDNGSPTPAVEATESLAELTSREHLAPVEESSAEAPLAEVEAPSAPLITEEPLDEETQRYVSQALTDVDLFSSYGLTQKASHLLENVLQRAPRHTATLERLLDLYLGAGNERRTAELSSQLEQIHRQRGDTVNAERFATLSQRFQKVAGITPEEMPPAPAAPAPRVADLAAKAETAPAGFVLEDTQPSVADEPAGVTTPGPTEFEIPLTPAGDDQEQGQGVGELEQSPVAAKPEAEAAQPTTAEPEIVLLNEEVDLSDEWEAMVQEVAEPGPEPAPLAESVAEPEPSTDLATEAEPERAAELTIEAVPEPELAAEPATEPVPEIVLEVEPEPAPEAVPVTEETMESQPVDLEPAESEPEAESVEMLEATPDPASEPSFEFVEMPLEETPAHETAAAESGEFELELTPEPTGTNGKAEAANTEDFLSELASEVEDMESPANAPVMAAATATTGVSEDAPEVTAESLNELAEVFEEFRNELGELGEEDEDLETHYNLGIAYREMGLLDEGIGEFQKVAKAVQNGKSFRYAMNCSTMLAVSFMDKGEPKIASLWYQRALGLPDLDQETILALRYDLGVSLDMAGEASAALDSFRQVYAMNIDYRDVADRIAILQKH